MQINMGQNKGLSGKTDVPNFGFQVNQLIQEMKGKPSTPEKKQEYEAKLHQKVKNGVKLSSSELEYVQKNIPELYRLIQRVENKKAAIEEKCKSAKSQEEIQDIYSFEMTHISKDDPAAELIRKAVQEAIAEFKDSKDYNALPKTVEQGASNHKGEKEQQYCTKLGEYQEVFVGEAKEQFVTKG